MKLARTLERDGFCVLPNLFQDREIAEMRKDVIANSKRMAKTRSQPGSFHLAGFHRYPSLSCLHARIAANKDINSYLRGFYEADDYYTIGLSDITVNRSQEWHTDLLRGEFAHLLNSVDPWADEIDVCIKALVYLQSGRSLRILPGSHRQRTPLNDDEVALLPELRNSETIELDSGDVVLMDIRTVHRGPTDEEMSSPELAQIPKILISTVFGRINAPFAIAMQAGNLSRSISWEKRWLKVRTAIKTSA